MGYVSLLEGKGFSFSIGPFAGSKCKFSGVCVDDVFFHFLDNVHLAMFGQP